MHARISWCLVAGCAARIISSHVQVKSFVPNKPETVEMEVIVKRDKINSYIGLDHKEY